MNYYPDKPESPLKALPSKVILSLFQSVVWALWWLSLVEHLKALFIFIGTKLVKPKKESVRYLAPRSVAIDLYEMLKWALLILFFLSDAVDSWMIVTTLYLLVSNLFSHFYYHLWRHAPVEEISHQQMQRRFVSFLLAFTFAIVAYGLIYTSMAEQILWPEGIVSIENAIYMSAANTFTLTYGDIGPASNVTRAIFVSQVIYAFVFVVMIIAKSLPGHS